MATVQITINGQEVPVYEHGLFTAQVLLNKGSNKITAIATLGDESDEIYVALMVENGFVHPVPGYSHSFMSRLMYEHEIKLKAGETQWLPVTLETRKEGPGGFSGSLVRVDREYGVTPLPWPEGLDAYLEPPEFTAYPNTTYHFYLVVSTAPELEAGTYYLHFSHFLGKSRYGSGWLEITVE